MKKLITYLLALTITTGLLQASTWTTDYSAALVRAKQEHKRVLLDFTGSDWCQYCQLLDNEVLATSSFEEFADAHYILVKVDFPQKPLPPSEKAANDALSQKFQIDGFPTLVVVDPDGKERGRSSGYAPGSGPETVIGVLKGIN